MDFCLSLTSRPVRRNSNSKKVGARQRMDDVIGLSQEEDIIDDDVDTLTAPENQDTEAEDSFRARSADVWQCELSGAFSLLGIELRGI